MLVIFGTRPEAIKLCPLVSALREQPFCRALQTVACSTGQHREMLSQALKIFGIQPDFELDVMRQNQPLPELTSRLMSALPPVFAEVQPAISIVQGDTTSTLCGALCSFYAAVDVAHVEAGLRTFNLRAPFPEEINRVLTSRLARLHFAATHGAAGNLIKEGVPASAITVTGNTGIDAVLSIRDRLRGGTDSGLTLALDNRKKLIVVTAHRRENFGPDFEAICSAISQLAGRDDVQIVWPVHRNPNVSRPAEAMLLGKPNVLLIEPLEYLPFVDLMQRAYFLLTDSGGIQEEAPSLGKPVLVLRTVTERPEAVEAGTVKLVGTDQTKIVAETVNLLDDPQEYERMGRLHNPYGDGHACARIAERLFSHVETALT